MHIFASLFLSTAEVFFVVIKQWIQKDYWTRKSLRWFFLTTIFQGKYISAIATKRYFCTFRLVLSALMLSVQELNRM